jgi:DnaK suppressor protein
MSSDNKNIPLPPDNYKPTKNEPYMNPIMLSYFKKILFDWKEQLLQESSNIQRSIEEHTARAPDYTDEGIIEEIRRTEYCLAKQDLELMEQIDYAVEKINNGSYGFCEETDQEIGIERLEAWPIATVTSEIQKKRETV